MTEISWQNVTAQDNTDEIIRRSRESAPGFKALGACIFAGGFSFGMEEAGFNVLGHMEMKKLELGVNVARQRWPVHVSDLDGWFGLLDDMGDLDVMYANPPCVAYAGTGKHEGTADARMCHVRNSAYGAAFRKQPTAWMWELVPGIFSKDLSWLQAMSFRAAKLGYECHAFLTSSALHGGFQDRRRFHFVASKVAIDWEASYQARPEWQGSKTLGQALEIVADAREKLSGSRDTLGLISNDDVVYNGAFCPLIEFTAPGMRMGHLPDEIMRKHYRPNGLTWSGVGRPGFSHGRGVYNRPSPNILGGYTVVHPEKDRYLTPRENATVMGFPLDYRFSDNQKGYKEIGCGLCTHNARFLGVAIKDALESNRPATVERMGPLRVIDWRDRVKTNALSMGEVESKKWFLNRHGYEPPKVYATRSTVDIEDE